MSLRILGAGIFALFCVFCGFASSERMKRRLDAFACLLDAVLLLEGQVVLMDRPLVEAILLLGEENRYWKLVSSSKDPLSEDTWKNAGAEMDLKSSEMETMLRLRRSVSRQARGESTAFALCREELKNRMDYVNAKWEREGELHKKMGALIGAAVFLLFC